MLTSSILTSVEFDDLLLLEELREVFSLRKSDDLALHILNVSLDVGWDWSAFVVVVSSDVLAGLSISDFNDVANFKLERSDVNDLSVDHNVAVADHLSSLEDGLCVSKSPDCSSKSKLKEAEEVERGIAAHSLRFLKRVRELLLKHVVVASDDLLCQKLLAVLRLSSILKVWTVLTERICSLCSRAVWSTPNVVADSSADVRLSSSISCHF